MAIVTVEKTRYTVDQLYQWDLNQVLEIRGLSLPSIPEIHFTNDAMDRAIVRQATMDAAGVITADVPNSLLQKPYKITAYVCIYEGETFQSLYSVVIPVKARNKPNDYTLENDPEVYSFNALENQCNQFNDALNAHSARRDNPHGVTRAQIGAAPDGYGLGGKSMANTNNDANQAVDNGWVTVYASTANGAKVDGSLFVESCNWGRYQSIKQLSTGCVLQRCQYNNVWGEWEWVNPPMYPGVEYRTTERYLGKPVYAKCIEFGYLPNNASKIVNISTPNKGVFLRYDVSTADTNEHLNTRVSQIWFNENFVEITTLTDRSTMYAYVTVHYTKTTD